MMTCTREDVAEALKVPVIMGKGPAKLLVIGENRFQKLTASCGSRPIAALQNKLDEYLEVTLTDSEAIPTPIKTIVMGQFCRDMLFAVAECDMGEVNDRGVPMYLQSEYLKAPPRDVIVMAVGNIDATATARFTP